MPLFLLLTVLLIVLIRVTGSRSRKESAQSSEEFWRREQEASFSRRSDISNLPYIRIPEELISLLTDSASSLPDREPDAEELKQLSQELCTLAQAPILNLTGLTNTELKLRYGTANLNTLTQCDENFTRLCRTLDRAGHLLVGYQLKSEAVRLLSYAVSCGSDIQSTYLLLAGLYQKSGNQDGLRQLLTSVSCFDDLRRSSLEAALQAYHISE